MEYPLLLDLLHEKAELIQVLEKVSALELHLRWFFDQEKSPPPRAYNENHFVSLFVRSADDFFEKESGLAGEKLERL